ncbi:MAG: hypothetical protein K0R57_3846 [Paenibacillaceae bacterium]|jgi:glutathione synthase/RimK-type ligase-like ATP-grasp enzyme|nr:hypothetical protein [Paenibacillaceae bacterium]
MTTRPYVGILLNKPVYSRLCRGKGTGHEKMSYYEEGAASVGLKACFLLLSSLTPGPSRTKIKALVNTNGRYVQTYIDMPEVIHNRAIHLDSKSARKLAALADSGVDIYNLNTRYDKLFLHNLLAQDPVILPHLPVTLQATYDGIRQMMGMYPSLILKPVNGSVGQGIMLLKQTGDGRWLWKHRSGRRQPWLHRYFLRRIPPLLLSKLRNRKYLVQQYLPLARYDGSPFDIRVSVQRGESGEWQLTGMVGKAAKRGAFLTNVAQGGTVVSLEMFFLHHPLWDPVDLKHRIGELSLHIARYMSSLLPGLADLGLDMGIMEDGHIIFIEANGRDQRYSFQEAGMMQEWKDTYLNPMAYASFLTKTNKSP